MNDSRRSRIQSALDVLREVEEEETDAFNAIPESLQGSEGAESMSEGVEILGEACDQLEGLL